MRLTLYTGYALRALIHLARSPETLTSIHDVAQICQIPQNYLVKVIHNLGRGGFVETTRGRGGGLRLGRPAEMIRVGEVVRFTEPDFALAPCFLKRTSHEACVLAGACGLQYALSQAVRAFLAVLDAITLADLLAASRRDEAAKEPTPKPDPPSA